MRKHEKQEIAKYSENIDETCNYCKEAKSTANHIRWQCEYFDEHRENKILNLQLCLTSTSYTASNAA